MKVYTEDEAYLGELTEVITTGANDVYTVRMENGKDVLIPAIGQCILNNFLQGKEPQYQTEATSFYTTFYNLN